MDWVLDIQMTTLIIRIQEIVWIILNGHKTICTSNFDTLEGMCGVKGLFCHLANLSGLTYGNVNENVRMERLRNLPRDRHLITEDKEEDRWMLEDKEFEMYAAYLLHPIESSYTMIEGGGKSHNDPGGGSWRLLCRTKSVEYHQRQLGNGYSICTSILLVLFMNCSIAIAYQ